MTGPLRAWRGAALSFRAGRPRSRRCPQPPPRSISGTNSPPPIPIPPPCAWRLWRPGAASPCAGGRSCWGRSSPTRAGAIRPSTSIPLKGRYMWRDMERICAALGLPLRRPDPFPQNSLLAARVALAFPEAKRAAFSRAVYRGRVRRGSHDRGSAGRRRVDRGAGRGRARRRSRAPKSPDNKAALKAACEEAKALGLPGAPCCVASDGEVFWGNDRLETALDWAARREGPAESGKLGVVCRFPPNGDFRAHVDVSVHASQGDDMTTMHDAPAAIWRRPANLIPAVARAFRPSPALLFPSPRKPPHVPRCSNASLIRFVPMTKPAAGDDPRLLRALLPPDLAADRGCWSCSASSSRRSRRRSCPSRAR